MSERRCAKCGKPYYRRSQVEAWIGQNPGHLGGWEKEVVKLCTTCMPPIAAQHLVNVAAGTFDKPSDRALVPSKANMKEAQKWLRRVKNYQQPQAGPSRTESSSASRAVQASGRPRR